MSQSDYELRSPCRPHKRKNSSRFLGFLTSPPLKGSRKCLPLSVFAFSSLLWSCSHFLSLLSALRSSHHSSICLSSPDSIISSPRSSSSAASASSRGRCPSCVIVAEAVDHTHTKHLLPSQSRCCVPYTLRHQKMNTAT